MLQQPLQLSLFPHEDPSFLSPPPPSHPALPHTCPATPQFQRPRQLQGILPHKQTSYTLSPTFTLIRTHTPLILFTHTHLGGSHVLTHKHTPLQVPTGAHIFSYTHIHTPSPAHTSSHPRILPSTVTHSYIHTHFCYHPSLKLFTSTLTYSYAHSSPLHRLADIYTHLTHILTHTHRHTHTLILTPSPPSDSLHTRLRTHKLTLNSPPCTHAPLAHLSR